MKFDKEMQEVTYETTDETSHTQRLKRKFQYRTTAFLCIAALLSNLVQLSYGMMVSWVSPASAKLFSNNTQLNPLGQPITTLQYSIIGSSQATGSIMGPLICGTIFDVFGRKRCLTVICLLMSTAIITLALATHIFIYYITLFIIGFSTGVAFVGLPVYISEITEDGNRGLLSCLVNIFSPLGTAITFLIGSYLSIRIFTLICALPALINAICFIFILPDSPVQLVLSNDRKAAREVLIKLRGKTSEQIEADLNKIDHELKETTSSTHGGCSRIITHRSSRNALIVAVGGYIIFVLTGVPAFIAYLQPIFSKAGTVLPDNICALMVSIVSIVCYILASIFVEKWGRRKIIMFSTLSGVIPLCITGLYFHFKVNHYEFAENISWFPIVGLMLFIFLNVFGTATVPVALMNEVFANQVKATGISIVVLVAGVLQSLTMFGFPLLMESVGISWCFWMFASLSVICGVFVYFFIPETKGKTLMEIQKMLANLLYVGN